MATGAANTWAIRSYVEGCMRFLGYIGIVAFTAVLPVTAARAFDDSKYPEFSGV